MDRDPFSIPVRSQVKPGKDTAKTSESTKTTTSNGGAFGKTWGCFADENGNTYCVNPPIDIPGTMTIRGIVTSAGTRQAILGAGESFYIVTPGFESGGIRVSAITDSAVSLAYRGKVYKLRLGGATD